MSGSLVSLSGMLGFIGMLPEKACGAGAGSGAGPGAGDSAGVPLFFMVPGPEPHYFNTAPQHCPWASLQLCT